MRNSVARIFLAVAATIPLTVLCAFAQVQSDEDIRVYSQELLGRIEQGRQSGQLSASSYQNLRGLWTNVDTIRQQYRSGRMSDPERQMMMNSLLNLDRQLTTNLHDDQNARYQNWDQNTHSWRQNWWSRSQPGSVAGGDFNQEIDAYQRLLKQRIDSGQYSRQLNQTQLNRLLTMYNEIETMQGGFRLDGFSRRERNAIMDKMTQLDSEITALLHDNDKSRVSLWDNRNGTWNQDWWLPGWRSTTNVSTGGDFNQDIDSYQRLLKQRIDGGQRSGQLNQAELNRLLTMYNEIETMQGTFRVDGFRNRERSAIMDKMSQLDREITNRLSDYGQSRYDMWNASTGSWSQNWWQPGWKNTSSTGGFNQEIDSYQRLLKQRIDAGREAGRLTPRELSRLIASFDEIDTLQKQYRRKGFDGNERNLLMNRLTQLDRDITSQIHDDDKARYGYWNNRTNSWSQNWWQIPNWLAQPGRPGWNPGTAVNTQPCVDSFVDELNANKSRIQRRIFRGQREGLLTASEYNYLSRDLQSLDDMQRRFGADGFNRNERAALNQKVDSIEANLSVSTSNDDGREASDGNWGRQRGHGRWHNDD